MTPIVALELSSPSFKDRHPILAEGFEFHLGINFVKVSSRIYA